MNKNEEVAIKNTVNEMYDNIIAYIEEQRAKHLDYEWIAEQAQKERDGNN